MRVELLNGLPVEVRVLVNDGVYSLYAVHEMPGVTYVLLTNANERYALSSDGSLVENVKVPEITNLNLGPAIRCAGTPERPTISLNLSF